MRCRLCTWMLIRTCCLNVWLCWGNSLLCGSPISVILAWFELAFYLFYFSNVFLSDLCLCSDSRSVRHCVPCNFIFSKMHLFFLGPYRICTIAGKHDKDAISCGRSGYDKKTSSSDNHFPERPWYQVVLPTLYLSTHISRSEFTLHLVFIFDCWYAL